MLIKTPQDVPFRYTNATNQIQHTEHNVRSSFFMDISIVSLFYAISILLRDVFASSNTFSRCASENAVFGNLPNMHTERSLRTPEICRNANANGNSFPYIIKTCWFFRFPSFHLDEFSISFSFSLFFFRLIFCFLFRRR